MVDRVIHHLEKEQKAIKIQRKRLLAEIKKAACGGNLTEVKEKLGRLSEIDTEGEKIGKALEILMYCPPVLGSTPNPLFTEEIFCDWITREMDDAGGYFPSVSLWYLAS